MVHQTERAVLSDGSVLRHVMSQRQADTQNTKSNIPPVWKTDGHKLAGTNTNAVQVLHRAYETKILKKEQYSTELERGKTKITTEECGITRARQLLHRAYANKKLKKEHLDKKNQVKKEPYKIGKKKFQPKRKKKIYAERYHKEEGKGMSKTRKKPKLAKRQPVAKRRLSKRRNKTREAIKAKMGTQIDQGKFSLVRNTTKNLYAQRKCGGKNLRMHTPQKSHKQSYWRGNQGCWSITV